VADPRLAHALELGDNAARHRHKLEVLDFGHPARTVTGTTTVGSGAPSVADPRWGGGRLGVIGWDQPSGTVSGDSLPSNGGFSVADPRVDGNKPAWQRVAGVTAWTEPAPVITAGAKIHAGAFQVADPRVQEIDVRLGCAPRAGAYTRWREAIGNAVPPPAAMAIGEQLLRALLLTALGVFALSGITPVWVAPERRAQWDR